MQTPIECIREILQAARDTPADHSVPVACEHEFEPLIGPHKECVLCGDVRKDQERKILDGYDDWCKQFIADFGYVPDVLDAFEGGKNNAPQSDAQSVRDAWREGLQPYDQYEVLAGGRWQLVTEVQYKAWSGKKRFIRAILASPVKTPLTE